MKNFEIELLKETPIAVNVTDRSIYNYDFNSFSLVPLQEMASISLLKKIESVLFSNVSKTKLMKQLANKGQVEYVANFSDCAKKKLQSGEWAIGVKKESGKLYSVLKNVLTGKTESFIELSETVNNDLGNLPELAAIQLQLKSISEQIESLNRIVQRVEQGQYNDRFAGFFASRQLIIEGLSSEDDFIKKELLLSAIKTNNETLGKLMFSINTDALTLIDTKTSVKDAKRIYCLMQTSLCYLNSSVQLNLIAYTGLGEQKSLFATLTNYYSFTQQVFMKKNKDNKTIAWLLDNGFIGNDGKIEELSNTISKNIEKLTKSYNLKTLEEYKSEK